MIRNIKYHYNAYNIEDTSYSLFIKKPAFRGNLSSRQINVKSLYIW